MKHIFIALAMLAATLAGSAQGFRLGIEAGFGMSDATNAEGAARPAYHAGLRGEYDFKAPDNGLYIAVIPTFASKGWSFDVKRGTFRSDCRVRSNALTLPLMAGYRIPLGASIAIGIETGPYVGYGIGGNAKSRSYIGAARPDVFDSADTYGAEGMYKRFEAGWRAGVALTISRHTMAGIDATFQFNDNRTEKPNKPHTIGITLGYMF